jgi:glycosyltransferase involved in cell wall biosynthesis
VEHIRLGHGTRLSDDEAGSRGTAFRERHGIPAGAIVFGCFGGLTPDKRIPQILDAFDAIRPTVPDARLLFIGAAADHYDVAADVSRRAPGASVIVAGYLEDDESLTDAVAASDVTLNLRWPTAREVSGPWLRALAAGRPSIIIDLAHMADLPTLDPRTWRTHGANEAEPVAVALDILDEDHSLRLAMRRLAQDPALRTALGRAGRRHWQSAHSHDAMLDDYRRVIARTIGAPVPDAPLPAHLRPDGGRVLREVLEPFGVPVPWSSI